jgi:hypothetical protein
MTSAQFDAMFPDEDHCKAYLQARRWPDGVRCARCFGDRKIFSVKSMPFKWQCYECAPNSGYRFSVIAGTIFENTNKPLRDWFKVVHLMLAGKKGMSSLQIKRYMGFGSYETALSMTHKIRAALIEPEQKLGGIVEVDETWVGGKDKNRHWDKKTHGVGGKASGRTADHRRRQPQGQRGGTRSRERHKESRARLYSGSRVEQGQLACDGLLERLRQARQEVPPRHGRSFQA